MFRQEAMTALRQFFKIVRWESCRRLPGNVLRFEIRMPCCPLTVVCTVVRHDLQCPTKELSLVRWQYHVVFHMCEASATQRPLKPRRS